MDGLRERSSPSGVCACSPRAQPASPLVESSLGWRCEDHRRVFEFANRSQLLAAAWLQEDLEIQLTDAWRLLASTPRVHSPDGKAAVTYIVRSIASQVLKRPVMLPRLTETWRRHGYCRHRRARAALAAVCAGYCDRAVSISETAKQIGVSRSRLSHLLTRETGFGFRAHLHGIRLLNAVELLSTTYLSVKEVAARVGYENTSSLDAQFRRWLGLIPTDFRHF